MTNETKPKSVAPKNRVTLDADCLSKIDGLVKQGAEGAILGCTEIPLLLKQSDCPTPLFDTTLIHSQAAVEFSLNS